MTLEWVTVAGGQSGAITRAQLLQSGLSTGRLRSLIRAGALEPVARGVYLLAGTRPDWRGLLWVGLLASGADSFVCRRSAAALWELEGVERGAVEIALPVGRKSRHPGTIRLHSTDPGDIVKHEGFPVTTVARTLLDLGSVVGPAVVERSVECALRRRLVSVPLLSDRAGRACSPGSRVLRDILGLRPDGAPPTESEAETRFVQIVRAMGLPAPRRQHLVILRGRKYRLDFAWPAIRLAVEIDGGSVHGPDALGADLYRQNQILLDGWFIVRFTPFMLERQVAAVERDVRAAWQLRSVVSSLA
jgi:very-short-patch-repair endonuclease